CERTVHDHGVGVGPEVAGRKPASRQDTHIERVEQRGVDSVDTDVVVRVEATFPVSGGFLDPDLEHGLCAHDRAREGYGGDAFGAQSPCELTLQLGVSSLERGAAVERVAGGCVVELELRCRELAGRETCFEHTWT